MGRSPTIQLPNNATVAIIGGGPAGSFTALHLLQKARQLKQSINVVIFERRTRGGPVEYRGCPQCAGGISPGLHDALRRLDITVPAEVVQANIESITLQGRWKHLRLPVPGNRKMLSVFRGTLPRSDRQSPASFDAMLLQTAVQRGARLISSRVTDTAYDGEQKPQLHYRADGENRQLAADFVVFACGVNERSDNRSDQKSTIELVQTLQPAYRPPGLRKALIFELEAPPGTSNQDSGELHFIESSEDDLHLDMCSILPKRRFFTVSLIGGSVDRASNHRENLEVIRRFLALPQIRRTLPPETRFGVHCACSPKIVAGSAKHATGHRLAVVGDMATCRQYKDGILSAYTMAAELSNTAVEHGLDQHSLRQGYHPVLAQFRRDNYYASLIFFLYRWFFVSPFLSRIIYQTYSSERKRELQGRRRFESILWAISSGDQSYRRIASWMVSPSTLWQIFRDGFLVTLMYGFGEHFFKLNWRGIGRFPVAVSRESLMTSCTRLLGGRSFEKTYLYRIEIRARPEAILDLLSDFGEPQRAFLNPRWVHIRRRQGSPLTTGCIIDYRIFGGLISFSIRQGASGDPLQIEFDVCGGFADGGRFIFLIEQLANGRSNLSVLLAFDYKRGSNTTGKIFWSVFRRLFPEFVHETLWNHALCELKQAAEAIDMHSTPIMRRYLA